MNKSEAYNILINEMKGISCLNAKEIDEFVSKPIESKVPTDTGALYTVEIMITKSEKNKYIISGNIHNNNSFKYELLEETLVINK